ncbi:MAG: hypothetical protein HFF50_10200 [Lawsonibacter sp.]|nr:hypothetical protein [Lawsonibacter sp.]
MAEIGRPTDPGSQKSKKGKGDGPWFFRLLMHIVHLEGGTFAGKVNLVGLVALAALIGLYMLTSTQVAVARLLVSMVNKDLTSGTNDNILPMLFVVVAYTAICVGFVYFVDQKHHPNPPPPSPPPPPVQDLPKIKVRRSRKR